TATCRPARSKGETSPHDARPILNARHWEPVEAAATPSRHLPEQPLSAETEHAEDREVEERLRFGREASGREIIPVPKEAEIEKKLGLIEISVDHGDPGDGSLELVRQVRDGAGKCRDLT